MGVARVTTDGEDIERRASNPDKRGEVTKQDGEQPEEDVGWQRASLAYIAMSAVVRRRNGGRLPSGLSRSI